MKHAKYNRNYFFKKQEKTSEIVPMKIQILIRQGLKIIDKIF